MEKVLVILGPTSSGKTDLALTLAKKFNGEILACDSRQVYKGLDIGTGKLPSQNSEIDIKKFDGLWEMNGIKVWMIDVADPLKRYDVSEYQNDAQKILNQVLKNEKLPIIVAGTGLYLKALLYGLPNLQIPFDPSLRDQLESLDLSTLQDKARKLIGESWNKLNNSERNNPRRLIRIIELNTLKPKSNKKLKDSVQKLNVLKIGLTLPREELNKRIDLRVKKRIDQGMIDEARNLLINELTLKRFRELGLEYGVLADYLEGKIDELEFTEKLKIKIHQYAKRQMTWFKKEQNVKWFNAGDKKLSGKVEMLCRDWYNAKV